MTENDLPAIIEAERRKHGIEEYPLITAADISDIRSELADLTAFSAIWGPAKRGSGVEMCHRIIPRLLAEVERLQRDHEAMELLRSHKIDFVEWDYVSRDSDERAWAASAWRQSVSVFHADDPAEAIVKAAKQENENARP